MSPFVIVSPLFEDAMDGNVLVTKTFCQNCGKVTSIRRFPQEAILAEILLWKDEDADLFMAHLATHYPPGADDN